MRREPQLNGWFGRMLKNVSQFIENNLSFIPYANSISSVLNAGASTFGTSCRTTVITQAGYTVCQDRTPFELPSPEDAVIENFFNNEFYPFLKKLLLKANSIISNQVADKTAAINEILLEIALLKDFGRNNTLDIDDSLADELEATINVLTKNIEDSIKAFLPAKSSKATVNTATINIAPIVYQKPKTIEVTLYGENAVATTQVSPTQTNTATTQVAVGTNGVEVKNQNNNYTIPIIGFGVLLLALFATKKKNN